MSGTNGTNGSEGAKEESGTGPITNRPARSRRPVAPPKPPGIVTPEQSCFGCLLGMAALVLAFVIWGIVYWVNEPSFH